MPGKELTARIKINKFLEVSVLKFCDDKHGKANIILESNVKIINVSIVENTKTKFCTLNILLDNLGIKKMPPVMVEGNLMRQSSYGIILIVICFIINL